VTCRLIFTVFSILLLFSVPFVSTEKLSDTHSLRTQFSICKEKIKIQDIESDLFINNVILYIWKYIIHTVCLLHVAATHVAIIREARYERWIYRDIKKVSEPMHGCKILRFKNRWFKIYMFRSILIIFRELLNIIKTYMNSKLMHGRE
jgi:hypothetical protein